MKISDSLSRTLVGATVVIALGTLTLGATGCAAFTGATTAPVAQASATMDSPAASAAAAAAAPPAAAGAAAVPTPALGRVVVKSSCVGRCHGSDILNYRTTQTSAQRIATSMGRKAGLSADKQQAVAIFFAQ